MTPKELAEAYVKFGISNPAVYREQKYNRGPVRYSYTRKFHYLNFANGRIRFCDNHCEVEQWTPRRIVILEYADPAFSVKRLDEEVKAMVAARLL